MVAAAVGGKERGEVVKECYEWNAFLSNARVFVFTVYIHTTIQVCVCGAGERAERRKRQHTKLFILLFYTHNLMIMKSNKA